MKRCLEIKNTVDLSLDKITCFELPIINMLNYLGYRYGNCFILISKIFSFYFYNLEPDVYYKELQLARNLLNLDFENLPTCSLNLKKIDELIIRNQPAIIGINLQEIFYSDYYKTDDWPHWVLVDGCDYEKKIIYILDGVQYRGQVDYCGAFCLPINIINKARKGYIKRYGKKWSGFSLKINETQSLKTLICKILSYYLTFDFSDKQSYAQIKILKQFQRIRATQFYNELEDDFKKKIVNTNKYRTIIFQTLIQFMRDFRFSDNMTRELTEANQSAEKIWDNYTTRMMLSVVLSKNVDIELPDEIIDIENRIKTIVKNFYTYLESYNVLEFARENTAICENNQDKIIEYNDDVVRFVFYSKRTYDWWFVNNSPKFIIKKHIRLENFRLSCDIKISDYQINDFQAGLFIRDDTQSIFCAYDLKGFLVLDEIGEISKSTEVQKVDSLKIIVTKYNGNILAEIYDFSGELLGRIERPDELKSSLDIGLSCKTWGNGGTVKATFQNYKIEEL